MDEEEREEDLVDYDEEGKPRRRGPTPPDVSYIQCRGLYRYITSF